MRSAFLPLALPVSLIFLLAACGHEEAAQTTVRPAMVVQPQPSAQAMDSYPGEVRARYEPDLAFRIGGKVPAELGQSARVFIQVDGVIPLSVPLSALSAENGASYVWRVKPDNTLERTPVRIGAFGENTVPVLEGLAATDWVVAAGVHVLHEGQPVRPVDRSNRVVNLAAKE